MIIAIDGYDGSGKTTIALQISKRINGTYVKSYNNDLGRVIWSLINDEEYELASLIARTACRKEAERYKDAPYVGPPEKTLCCHFTIPQSPGEMRLRSFSPNNHGQDENAKKILPNLFQVHHQHDNRNLRFTGLCQLGH
jgi:hypothetical protein